MITKERIKFTKDAYTLRDFAKFKLCPMMYKCSILYPNEPPIGSEQSRLYTEADILSKAFSGFCKKVTAENRTYYKNTSLCLADIVEEICIVMRETSADFEKHDIELITNGLYDKAEGITEGIHRWLKGSRYTIDNGVKKDYPMQSFRFSYFCDFRSADRDNGGFRSIYINEYKDFPVFSTGSKGKGLIHYSDICDALNSDDPSYDRVALAMKIMRKINIQIETRYYEQDGLARISALGNELNNFDFNGKCKKPSSFCSYCKYFDKCRYM